MHDLRFAFSQLLKNPGFTAVTVLTLALGIGANKAMFSLVHAVILRSLPFKDPERLVMLWDSQNQAKGPVSLPHSLYSRAQIKSRDRMAACLYPGYNLTRLTTDN